MYAQTGSSPKQSLTQELNQCYHLKHFGGWKDLMLYLSQYMTNKECYIDFEGGFFHELLYCTAVDVSKYYSVV